MVLDSGRQSFRRREQQPDVFGAGLQQRRSGKKEASRPYEGLRVPPFFSPSLSLDSDSSSPGQRAPPKTKCLQNPEPQVPPPMGLCPAFQNPCSWMRRSESICAVNRRDRARGQIRSAASLPHLPKAKADRCIGAKRKSPCLLVALRPVNVDKEREKFFGACYAYNPQFEYAEPVPEAVLEKYKEASGQFISQVRKVSSAPSVSAIFFQMAVPPSTTLSLCSPARRLSQQVSASQREERCFGSQQQECSCTHPGIILCASVILTITL